MKILKAISILVATVLMMTGCTSTQQSQDSGKLKVIATTAIIADFVKNVAKDKAEVIQLVPTGADPHSYEPSIRQLRDITTANIAFSNYLLLEEHAIVKMLDSNLPAKAKNVAIAESAIPKGMQTIHLIEDRNLDTIWLGLRVKGSGENLLSETKSNTDEQQLQNKTRASQVYISLKKLKGPGQMYGYLNQSFEQPDIYFDSTRIGDGEKATLPTDAHTHMSWAFTKAGIYHATFKASYKSADGKTVPVGQATYTFAVGVDAHKKYPNAVICDRNHADITVDLDDKKLSFAIAESEGSNVHKHDTTVESSEESAEQHTDEQVHDDTDEDQNQYEHQNHDEHSEQHHSHGDHSDVQYAPEQVVIEVPNKAITQIPAEQDYRFLGRAGTQIYLLPQAVLGKHVHGDIDPHLWLDVSNSLYYVDVIAENLQKLDPKNASYYAENAKVYKEKLRKLDVQIQKGIASIDPQNRYLVTTHDSFGYFANKYGLKVAGFVTPNPSTQPSVAQRKKLTQTIHNLKVKAVFLEPNLITKSSVLNQIATEQNVKVCPIWSDSFTDGVQSYEQMMRANLKSLEKCLGDKKGK